MAVSIAQYVDLLFKKLQGVAKTANSTVKSASNESIASPAFLRGDVVWMQSDQIPGTAQVVTGVTTALTGGSSIECTADTTVPPIGGIRPTWLTNETYWISQEFGSTWLPKVFVGPSGAANIEATGTQIFSAGIGGVGEYYFDTQAGVLNFIGETIPTVLTAGNVVYVAAYQYVGDLGVTNIPSGANIGNLNFTDTTISSTTANLVTFGGTSGIIIPAGNTDQRPSPATTATIRFNTINGTLEIWDGSAWISGTGDISVISNQTLNGDGSTTVFSLDQAATADSILVSINGVVQTPGVDYTTASGPDVITFTTAPAGGDVIQVRFISTTSTVSALYNGTSNINIPISSGNAVISVGGVSNVMTVTSTGANIAGYANVTGNILVGNVSATGNVTGNYILGNGALLTGVITSVANINSGNSNVTVVSSGGNVTVGVGGTSNVVVFSATGEYVTGVISASGNATAGNILTGGLISATGNATAGNISATNHTGTTVSVTANITGGNVLTGGLISATGNATAGNILTGGTVSATGNVVGSYFIGNVSTNSIVNSGSNGTGNIGSASTTFNTIFAKSTSSQYADLAEFYSADQTYTPGTVVIFGGNYEVTLSTQDADPCVAGVVSTNPSYIMNAGIFAEFPTQVTLTGRVPCRVVGAVTKGAMMVSAGNGSARAEKSPAMGTVIGKALEAFEGDVGTIEIVVGRL